MHNDQIKFNKKQILIQEIIFSSKTIIIIIIQTLVYNCALDEINLLLVPHYTHS
jgi:hypothetical protein